VARHLAVLDMHGGGIDARPQTDGAGQARQAAEAGIDIDDDGQRTGLLDGANPRHQPRQAGLPRSGSATRHTMRSDGGFVDPGPFDPVEAPDHAPLLQPFTSGTTGLPKGMPLSARAVRWAMRLMMPASRAPDPTATVTAAHPPCHKSAMLGSKGAFLHGGRVVMMERFERERFVAAIGEWGVTKVHTVPTMMARAGSAA
jgi:acyl-CoA synthetase (AMP-forming)/AMP-acid ligase II